MTELKRYKVLHWNEQMGCWDAHGVDEGRTAGDVVDRYERTYGGKWQAEVDADALGVGLSVPEWMSVLGYAARSAQEIHDEADQRRLWGIIQALPIRGATRKFLTVDEWAFLLAWLEDPAFNLTHRKGIEQQLRRQEFDFDLVEKYKVY